MTDPTPQEVDRHIENINENLATLNLVQEKDNLVLYGSKDIHFPGMIEDVETLKIGQKNINGMPQQVKELTEEVKELKEKVNCLVETDKKRVWFIRGAVSFATLQGGGLIAIIAKVFS